MKKIILMLLLSLGIFAVQAQEPTKKTAEEKAAHQTTLLEKKLGLNADQKEKIYAINLQKTKEMEALRANTDMAERRSKLAELKEQNAKSDQEINAVLTTEQQKMYIAWKDEMKDKMANRKPHKKGARAHSKTDSATVKP